MLAGVVVTAQVDQIAQHVRRQQHVVRGDVHLLRRAALLLEDHRVRAVVVGLTRDDAQMLRKTLNWLLLFPSVADYSVIIKRGCAEDQVELTVGMQPSSGTVEDPGSRGNLHI